jgi:streptomycin 6-kinase
MTTDLGPWLALWRLTADGEATLTATGVVQFVRRGAEPLVLKLIAHDDETDQPLALAAWSGCGAVRLVEHDGRVMLMERAVPGRPLRDLVLAGRDDEATGVICDVIERLGRAPACDLARFRTVEDWGLGFARVRTPALASGVEAELIDRAASLYRDLCASQGPRRLLHGDLQHYNILEDERRGWLAVDPKAVVGEAAYETGAALRNPIEAPELFADPAIIVRRASLMSERLGLDRDRLIAWCFAQAVLSALWAIEDGEDPSSGLRMAQAIPPLVRT